MGSQSSVHDNSFMDSQSLLDCSTQSQQPPQSPTRSNSATDIPQAVPPSAVIAPRVEASILAKVQPPYYNLFSCYTNFLGRNN